jgi:predicted DNA-binding protein
MNRKSYIRMTTEELAAATREYDHEMVETKRVPMPPSLKSRLKKVMSKPSRSKAKRQAPKRVQISLEDALLQRADEVAKKHGITRSELIAAALRRELDKKIA